ncbi:MAG: ACP S-malonyltransferase [Deltaproteobacteria bacterium]|nr:ACP S-malonyltransferase [Deltaproteobacteria bacterium]
MSKTAIVFPGQGSQFVCMGKTFYDEFDAARKTYEEANDALGYDIARLSFDGPQTGLDRTENTQPALLTAGIAAYRALCGKVQLTPAYFAGHSLGEYTALVAAGVIEFRDAVRLVRLRGKFMQEGVPEGVGKMCAILGLDLEAVTVICDSASLDAARVVPANINTSEQIVISGHAAAVDIAASLAKERGAKRVVPLPVSAPSHSPLMEGAAERLDAELEKIKFGSFNAPVLTNVEAEPLTDPSRVRELLKLQLTSPVRWVDIIKRMRADGVGTVIEVGPGKVLTGLAKRIEKEMNALSLSEAGDMDRVLEALR